MSDPHITHASPPSKLWYLLVPLIALAGIFAFAQILLSELEDFPTEMRRFEAPGSIQITAPGPAGYTVFYEYETEGATYGEPPAYPASMIVEVKPVVGGGPVSVERSGPGRRYKMGRQAGLGVVTFEVPAEGTYEVRAHYPEGDGPTVQLTVSTGMTAMILWVVVAGLVILFGTALILLLVARRIYLKRQEAPATLEADREEHLGG